MRTYGAGKRRTWRKLHLCVDEADGTILAHELTGSGSHDGQRLAPLLDQAETKLAVPGARLAMVTGDGAYDSFDCHRTILDRDAEPVIPPRAGASLKPPSNLNNPPLTRGQAVKEIWAMVRKAWKQWLPPPAHSLR